MDWKKDEIILNKRVSVLFDVIEMIIDVIRKVQVIKVIIYFLRVDILDL